MTGITIIGGGTSGIFLTIQLMRSKPRFPLRITLIEKENDPWLGVAYSTDKPYHLLNVRAARMSALPDEENDFVDWLHAHNYNITPIDFAPRFLFRKYVEDVFQKTSADKPADVELNVIHDEAIGIQQINEREAVVQLRNEQPVVSNFIVLALGNFTSNSSLTEKPALHKNPSYYDNPWARNILDNLRDDAEVLILGTGPTMIDTVLTMYYQKHKGKITALSRHGLLPSQHALTEIYPDFSEEMKDVCSLAEAVRIVRRHIFIAEKNGIGWRAVIDSMRPFTQRLWLDLSLQSKIDFLKNYKTYWEVSRSRMPEECATVIQEMIDSKSLTIMPGRIKAFEKQAPRIKVQYTNTKTGERDVILADAVINCMGPGLNFEKLKDPLVESLVKQGMICNSPVAIGINALPDGTILKKDGTPSKTMYTLGSPLRGVLWETIAIPEIRVQARKLASLFLQEIILKEQG